MAQQADPRNRVYRSRVTAKDQCMRRVGTSVVGPGLLQWAVWLRLWHTEREWLGIAKMADGKDLE